MSRMTTDEKTLLPLFAVLEASGNPGGDEATGDEVVFCVPGRRDNDAATTWLRRMLLFVGLQHVSQQLIGQDLSCVVFQSRDFGAESAPTDSANDGEIVSRDRFFTVVLAAVSGYVVVVACPDSVFGGSEKATLHAKRVRDAVRFVCSDFSLLRSDPDTVARVSELFEQGADEVREHAQIDTDVFTADLSVEVQAEIQGHLMELDAVDLMWQADHSAMTFLEPASIDHSGSLLLSRMTVLGSTLPLHTKEEICNYLEIRGTLARGRGRSEFLQFLAVHVTGLNSKQGSVAEMTIMQRYGLTLVTVGRLIAGSQPNRTSRVSAMRSVLLKFRSDKEG